MAPYENPSVVGSIQELHAVRDHRYMGGMPGVPYVPHKSVTPQEWRALMERLAALEFRLAALEAR